MAVVGGAKVADKLGVLKALLHHVDALVVGGGMAFTFLAAPVTTSAARWSTTTGSTSAPSCSPRARPSSCPPTSWPSSRARRSAATAPEGRSGRCGRTSPTGGRASTSDRTTVEAYAEAIGTAGTVLWNGPMGVFEDDRFGAGTAGVAGAVADCAGYTVVGGGDSAAAVDELGLADRIDFISTGGGASLELLEFGDLPGLAALRGAPNAPGASAEQGRSQP